MCSAGFLRVAGGSQTYRSDVIIGFFHEAICAVDRVVPERSTAFDFAANLILAENIHNPFF